MRQGLETIPPYLLRNVISGTVRCIEGARYLQRTNFVVISINDGYFWSLTMGLDVFWYYLDFPPWFYRGR